jgi:hypothetical protein
VIGSVCNISWTVGVFLSCVYWSPVWCVFIRMGHGVLFGPIRKVRGVSVQIGRGDGGEVCHVCATRLWVVSVPKGCGGLR